jgi:HD-GYP domain-containing protein (c-di-GMP phosphodiesterase class II)
MQSAPNLALRLDRSLVGSCVIKKSMVYVQNIQEYKPELFELPDTWENERFKTFVGVPLIARGKVKGVLEMFKTTSVERDEEWFQFMNTIAEQVAIAIDNSLILEDLRRSNLELTLAYDTTLEGWAKALEMRDKETEGHSRRVTRLTLDIARSLGMEGEELIHVRRGTILHDIGKMGIADSILLKEGPLTEEEWEIMRQHPIYAYNLLSTIPFLKPALDIPYCHHEKWDGSGYPRGINGEQIPIAARIFSLVDVWDALISDRPYRKAWPEEKVISYIREQSGKHFDPSLVDIFLEKIQTNNH